MVKVLCERKLPGYLLCSLFPASAFKTYYGQDTHCLVLKKISFIVRKSRSEKQSGGRQIASQGWAGYVLEGRFLRPVFTGKKPEVAGQKEFSGNRNKSFDLGSPHAAHLASYQLIGRPHWGQRQRSSSFLTHS
jgi:hypothetical protein